jgi:hypothetical protein
MDSKTRVRKYINDSTRNNIHSLNRWNWVVANNTPDCLAGLALLVIKNFYTGID